MRYAFRFAIVNELPFIQQRQREREKKALTLLDSNRKRDSQRCSGFMHFTLSMCVYRTRRLLCFLSPSWLLNDFPYWLTSICCACVCVKHTQHTYTHISLLLSIFINSNDDYWEVLQIQQQQQLAKLPRNTGTMCVTVNRTFNTVYYQPYR